MRDGQHPRWDEARTLAELRASDLAPLGALEIGVATSAFQTEGGLDGPGEPATNWRAWIAAGRAERIGSACALWERYPLAAQRCAALGLQAFRLGLEWSRLAPDGRTLERSAVEAYAERIAALHAAALAPIVTLQHFTHPAALGPDFWLDADAPERFARYAAAAVSALGDALVRRGLPPLARILTLNEPNMLAPATYIAGVFPHGRGALAQGSLLGGVRALRAFDHLLAAHVRAYRAVHGAYAARGWPAPDVSFNLVFVDQYVLGRMPFDLVRAPSLGVGRDALARHCARGRDEFYAALSADEHSPRTAAARALDRLLGRALTPARMGATVCALYERPGERAIDSLALDLYDPWSYQQLRGGAAALDALARGALLQAPWYLRGGVALAEPWQWAYEPDTLPRALASLHERTAPLPIDVMENGMAYERAVGSPCAARSDGVSRTEFLRGYALALCHARAVAKLPARTYCHWTLVDNYELGRYSPRFGLYALPDPLPDGAAAPWSERDCAGDAPDQVLMALAKLVATARTAPTAAHAALEALAAG